MKRTPSIKDLREQVQVTAKELEEVVEKDLARWSRGKPIEKPAELTAGEYDIKLPYHPQETPSDIEDVGNARMKLAPDGDKKEISQEKSASDLENVKNFFEYLIIKQNKALQDNMEKQHRELLECLHSETKKNTDLISQVKNKTEE
jgi:hypothetical protein